MNADEARKASLRPDQVVPGSTEALYACVMLKIGDATARGKRRADVDFHNDPAPVRDAVIARLRADGYSVFLDTADGVHGVSW